MSASPDPAIDLASGVVDAVRAVCLAVEEAVDRAGVAAGGAGNPLPRTGVHRWDSALTEAWQALALVQVGIGQARRLPSATPASVGDVLDGLRMARAAADRAAGDVARVRRGLATAEDRLRRVGGEQPAAAAADRWGAACARLDLAAARLAVGTRALDRYAEQLEHGTERPAPRLAAAAPPEPADLRAGVTEAGALLLRVYSGRGRRGFLARVCHELRRQYALGAPSVAASERW